MTKHKIKIPPELCTFDDIATLPLMPPSRRQALKMADEGKFPPYLRPHAGYSAPVWKRTAILEWLREKFGKLLPDVIREIELSGELVPTAKPKTPRPSVNGRKNARFNEA